MQKAGNARANLLAQPKDTAENSLGSPSFVQTQNKSVNDQTKLWQGIGAGGTTCTHLIPAHLICHSHVKKISELEYR